MLSFIKENNKYKRNETSFYVDYVALILCLMQKLFFLKRSNYGFKCGGRIKSVSEKKLFAGFSAVLLLLAIVAVTNIVVQNMATNSTKEVSTLQETISSSVRNTSSVIEQLSANTQ